MNRVSAMLFVSLVACGSGGSGPALFGGFSPTSGAAVILAPATCNNIPFVGSTAVSGILVELTSGADACNVLTQAKQCGTGSGSRTLLAVALSGVVGGSTVGPAGPGTYPWLASPPSGAFSTSIGRAAQVDALCTSLAGSPTDVSGGSIAVSTVTASAVTGSMDLRFEDGQTYQGPFDVPVCPVTIDICSLFDPCMSHSCVQP